MAQDTTLARHGPHPTGPHPTGPHPTGPRPTGPHLTGPHPTGPRPTEPHLTGPHPTGPHPIGPHLTGPHPSNMNSPRKKLSKKEEMEQLEKLFTEQVLQDTECGLGPCRSRWLQALATKESFIVLFSLSAIVQGMFFTYTVSVVSTIEKRFKLTSKQTGVMLAGNDVSAVLLAVFLGYYGNAGHRPRWLGFGLVLAAVASFVATLPHLLYGPGHEAKHLAHVEGLLPNITGNTSKRKRERERRGGELCPSRLEDLCETVDDGQESHLAPVFFLFLSQFFVGISMSIFYSVGVSFLDDNINKKTTSFYYSIYLLLRILGPVLGFLLGGQCLSLWINPTLHPNLTPQDPRWLGAWWLGFVLMGGLLLVVGWCVALYPRQLPATLRRQTRRLLCRTQGAELDPVSAVGTNSRSQRKTSLKNLAVHLKKLSRNQVWMANVFNTILAVLATSGYKIFKPKYLEHQFRQTASQANYYTGMTTMAAAALGTVVSAAVLRWGRPSAKFVTGYNVFVTLLDCACYVTLMFIGCPDINVIGPVHGGSLSQSGCWRDCGCSERFSPVCGQDLTTLYYSPCYAGCTLATTSDTSHVVYSECRCVTTNLTIQQHLDPHLTSSQTGGSRGSATQGFCPETCSSFVYYLLVQVVMDTAYSTAKIGTTIIHLRSVADEDKGLAVGVLEMVIALFGFIPAPIIMGAIIDSSCVLWDTSCGRRGNCWVYDSSRLRMITHLVPAGLVLISVLGDLVMYRYSHLLDLYGQREQHVEMEPANEEEAKMEPANEKEANMEPANEEANMEPANEKEAKMEPANEKEAKMEPANEKEAKMEPANEKEAKMEPANEKEAKMEPANEKEAKMEPADEKEAKMEPADAKMEMKHSTEEVEMESTKEQ